MSTAVAATVALSLVATGAPSLAAHAAEGAQAPTAVLAGGQLPMALAAKPTAKAAQGMHRIKISWKGATAGTKMWVVGAESYENLQRSTKRFKVGVKKLSSTTGYFTVPSKFRSRIGGNTGRLVYMYVYASRAGVTKKSPMLVSLAGVKKATGTTKQRIKIATYNVAAIPATAKISGQTWKKRRVSVVNAIVKASPDIIAVQESGLSWTGYPRSTGKFQAIDLKDLLASRGYVMNVNEAKIRAVVQGKYTTRETTSWLFYKKSSVKMLATGLRSSGGGAAKDRYYSWGKFQSLRSGKVFYAASVHLQTGDTTSARNIRARQINNWASFMSAKAGRAPVFIAGDYNCDFRTENYSAAQRMVVKGWQDAAASASRSNFKYGSTNDKPRTYQGFAPKPTVDAYGQGGKIDHIMSKNTTGVFKYVNQIVLKNGRFVESYRGSDHNLQYAIIGIK